MSTRKVRDKSQRQREALQRRNIVVIIGIALLAITVLILTLVNSGPAPTPVEQFGPTYTPTSAVTQVFTGDTVTITTANGFCAMLAGSGLSCDTTISTIQQHIAAYGCATDALRVTAAVENRVNVSPTNWSEPWGWTDPLSGDITLNLFRLADWTTQDVANGIYAYYQSRQSEFDATTNHEVFHACGGYYPLPEGSFGIPTGEDFGLLTYASYFRGFAACDEVNDVSFCLKGLEEAAASVFDSNANVYPDLESWMLYVMDLRGISLQQLAIWHNTPGGISLVCNAIMAKTCEFYDINALIQMPGSPRWDKLTSNEARMQLIFDNAAEIRGFYGVETATPNP